MKERDDPRFAVDRLWLTFKNPDAEQARWADFAVEIQSYARLGIVLLLGLYSAFVLNDLFVLRDELPWMLALRFGFVVPCLVAALVASYSPRAAPWLRAHIQEYLLGLGIVVCAGMLAMGWVLAPGATAQQLWVAGLVYLVTLMGVYGFSRLRFGYAVGLGLATTVLALLLLRRAPPQPGIGLVLATFGMVMNLAGAWMTRTLELLGRREFAQRQLLAEARARSDSLLRNALPVEVAARLRAADGDRVVIADRHDAVTVVLADIVDFTPLCERLPAEAIAALLDSMYSPFDALCAAHGVEKIKTLGDAWLAASGVPRARPDHAIAAARLALEMRAVAEQIGPALRIGIHTGPAVAGVIGRTRFAYDLWGDAVTGAAAMERGSRPGGIRVSAATAAALHGAFVLVEDEDGVWLMGERADETPTVTAPRARPQPVTEAPRKVAPPPPGS
ncbi:MAG: adenylate/guanylate cyclase domain-containing protein [Pseudomonadota bacterium]|nr:adenylate/guanylate cyclase domain-containing protein [Pseudomonadota bacterium]